MLDSIRFKELAQIRQQVGDYEEHGLSEISHARSLYETSISILSPVLLEDVSENEPV